MDLLSITAPAAEVAVGGADGQTVTVRGLTLNDIAALLGRFPDVLALFSGRDIDMARLLTLAPGAAVAIMAAAAGHLGDEQAEKVCATLGLERQTNILLKVGELTFPGGIGPFVEKIGALTASLPDLPKANGAGGAPDHGTPAMN